MVIVKKIDCEMLLKFGFESERQARDAYKGIKSLKNESVHNYLARTYNQVKHIIDANDLRKIEREETENRKLIVFYEDGSRYHNFNSVHLVNLTDKLLRMNNILSDQINILRNEQSIKSANNKKQLFTLTTKDAQEHECSICNEIIKEKETVYDVCHNFHIRCLTIWLIDNNTCPCCRSELL